MYKMENTKIDLSLDFTKPRVPRGGQQAPILVTPSFNLSTPEVSKMITEEELAVLTPNGISSVISQTNILPSPLIPTTVNSSNYDNINNANSNNFNGTSNNNHHHKSSQNGTSKKTSAPDNINGTNSNNKQNVRQDDLEKKEKLEKKRERNRLAAKKCRQRKVETIDELRKEVMQWEQRYKELRSEWEQKYRELELEFEQFKKLRSKDAEFIRR